MPTIRIASINIAFDSHIPLVTDFLATYKPDVITLQEVLYRQIPAIAKVLEMRSTFAATSFLKEHTPAHLLGNATLSRLPISNSNAFYYRGDPTKLPLMSIPDPKPWLMARPLLHSVVVDNDCVGHHIFNTHFTWSANAAVTPEQKRDCALMLEHLATIPEFILGGDFNAPRGTEIFDTIAAKYKDNIPSNITSTLDSKLHHAGHLQLMIDGLFTTPYYTAKDVQIISGVSDHCAILADVHYGVPTGEAKG